MNNRKEEFKDFEGNLTGRNEETFTVTKREESKHPAAKGAISACDDLHTICQSGRHRRASRCQESNENPLCVSEGEEEVFAPSVTLCMLLPAISTLCPVFSASECTTV